MSTGFNSSVELKAGRTPMTRSGVWFKYITVRPIGFSFPNTLWANGSERMTSSVPISALLRSHPMSV